MSELGATKVKVVEKPWGSELWFAHTEHYAGKVIKIRKGCKTSLQYHQRKIESLYLLSGCINVLQENEQGKLVCFTLNPGDTVTNISSRKHRVEGLEDSEYIEVSTPELNDVIRIEDDYGR